MKRHIKDTHLREKKYERTFSQPRGNMCKVCNTGKTYKKNHKLKVHIAKKHSGQEIFQAGISMMKFLQRNQGKYPNKYRQYLRARARAGYYDEDVTMNSQGHVVFGEGDCEVVHRQDEESDYSTAGNSQESGQTDADHNLNGIVGPQDGNISPDRQPKRLIGGDEGFMETLAKLKCRENDRNIRESRPGSYTYYRVTVCNKKFNK